MTGLEITLLIMPTGGLLIAAFLLWYTKPDKRKHHPGE